MGYTEEIRNLHYRYPNGDEVFIVPAVYRAERVTGKLQINPAEHIAAAYFNLQSLPVNLSPPIIPIFEKLIRDGSL
jgi:hypothetical protein